MSRPGKYSFTFLGVDGSTLSVSLRAFSESHARFLFAQIYPVTPLSVTVIEAPVAPEGAFQ